MLAIFLPGLLFQAAITLDRTELKRHLLPIGLLATAGVALTVVTIGVLAHLLLGLGWGAGMLLGAVLAATDPVAVVSLLRRLRAPAGVAVLLEGESLFNDGTGVAAFTAILGATVAGRPAAGEIVLRFLLLTAAGVAVGTGVGLAGRLLLGRLRGPATPLMVSLAGAYLSYLLAEAAGGSGVVACVAAGLVMATVARRSERAWHPISVALNAVLFLLLGLQFPAQEVVRVGWLVPALFIIMLGSRLLPVYGLLQASDPRVTWIPWPWRHLTWWSGMRGGLSIVLALSLGDRPEIDPRLAPAAYGVVVLSLLIQGGLLWPVARLLGLTGSWESPPRRDVRQPPEPR